MEEASEEGLRHRCWVIGGRTSRWADCTNDIGVTNAETLYYARGVATLVAVQNLIYGRSPTLRRYGGSKQQTQEAREDDTTTLDTAESINIRHTPLL